MDEQAGSLSGRAAVELDDVLEKLRAEEFAKAIGKPQATVEDDAAVAVAERIAHLVWAR